MQTNPSSLSSDYCVNFTSTCNLGVCVGSKVHRAPGDKWMVDGPGEFIPRIEMGKVEKR